MLDYLPIEQATCILSRPRSSFAVLTSIGSRGPPGIDLARKLRHRRTSPLLHSHPIFHVEKKFPVQRGTGGQCPIGIIGTTTNARDR